MVASLCVCVCVVFFVEATTFFCKVGLKGDQGLPRLFWGLEWLGSCFDMTWKGTSTSCVKSTCKSTCESGDREVYFLGTPDRKGGDGGCGEVPTVWGLVLEVVR